jgi:glycosyltransferase involved in cell wall biosynthesis
MESGVTDYRMMTRKVVDAVIELSEYNRFTKGIFSWVGFNTKWLCFENVERVAGKTSWSFWGLLKYSLEGIFNFSTAPLLISSFFGIIFCIISIITIIIFVIKTIVFGDPVPGFPTLICVVLFIGGIQLFCVGLLGQYLSKTFLEVKKRPIFIVKDTNISDLKKSAN